MKLTETEPLNHVQRVKYDGDWFKRIPLSGLDPGHQYTARAIVNQRSEEAFAADFLVVVNEIIWPRRSRINWMASQAIKISLSPIDLDGGPSLEEDIQPIREDGVTYTRQYGFLAYMARDTGYFLGTDDSFDKELSEVLNAPITDPRGLQSA